jgi:hypothetical protein
MAVLAFNVSIGVQSGGGSSMTDHRPQDTASKTRSHRFRAGVVRVVSVTAVAVTACALWAGAASAATATKFNTTTKITNTVPGSIHVGQSFTFDVTVTSAGGSAATGKVAVKPTKAGLPAAYSCTVTLSGGKGTCTVKPTEYGVVDYTATYGGDATHNGSTSSGTYPLEVKNVTTTTVGPKTAAAGTVTLTADVYAMGANITVGKGGTGTVAFSNGTKVIAGCSAQKLTTFTAPNNVATCKTTLAKGTYTINAVYSGDETNVGSKGTVTLTVS